MSEQRLEEIVKCEKHFTLPDGEQKYCANDITNCPFRDEYHCLAVPRKLMGTTITDVYHACEKKDGSYS